jgi:hypothetical protein
MMPDTALEPGECGITNVDCRMKIILALTGAVENQQREFSL